MFLTFLFIRDMAGATSAAAILLHASLKIHFGGHEPSQLMTTQGTLLVSRYKCKQLSSTRKQKSVFGPFVLRKYVDPTHILWLLHSLCTSLRWHCIPYILHLEIFLWTSLKHLLSNLPLQLPLKVAGLSGGHGSPTMFCCKLHCVSHSSDSECRITGWLLRTVI